MDASYKIQRGIHVHLIQFFMCPEFWVHIREAFASPVFSKIFPPPAVFALTFAEKSCIIVRVVKAYNFTEGGSTVKNQTYRMTMLFDFYGDILTQRQRELFDLYYNEDLSLSEIAENCGISRQGVRDVIVRAEAAMTELEDKTGLVKRFLQMQQHVDAVIAAANEIKTVNYRQYENPQLEELADTILTSAAALKE